MPSIQPSSSEPKPLPRHVAVVGAGLAGLRTVEQLRECGYLGELTLIGAESHLPYDRPPLSKQMLLGSWGHDRIALTTTERLAELGVQVRLGVPAAELLAGGVRLADDSVVEADAVVIATGANARRLPSQPDAVHVLRSLDDATRLRTALLCAGSVLVVGAGFIGGEVASGALTLGVAATVVESASLPLGRVLGEDAGRLAARLMTEAGVDLHLRCGVESIATGPASGMNVALSDGRTVHADVVVVGVGATPSIGWLAGSGLDLSDGVQCGSTGRAHGRTGVWAVGDVAAWELHGSGSRRQEHWTSADHQAAIVARDIMGSPVGALAVPYVWSDQFGLKVQVLGRPGDADEVLTLHGDGPSGGPVGGTVLGYTARDRICAVVGFGAPRLVGGYRGLLAVGAGRDEVLERSRH